MASKTRPLFMCLKPCSKVEFGAVRNFNFFFVNSHSFALAIFQKNADFRKTCGCVAGISTFGGPSVPRSWWSQPSREKIWGGGELNSVMVTLSIMFGKVSKQPLVQRTQNSCILLDMIELKILIGKDEGLFLMVLGRNVSWKFIRINGFWDICTFSFGCRLIY